MEDAAADAAAAGYDEKNGEGSFAELPPEQINDLVLKQYKSSSFGGQGFAGAGAAASGEDCGKGNANRSAGVCLACYLADKTRRPFVRRGGGHAPCPNKDKAPPRSEAMNVSNEVKRLMKAEGLV